MDGGLWLIEGKGWEMSSDAPSKTNPEGVAQPLTPVSDAHLERLLRYDGLSEAERWTGAEGPQTGDSGMNPEPPPNQPENP